MAAAPCAAHRLHDQSITTCAGFHVRNIVLCVLEGAVGSGMQVGCWGSGQRKLGCAQKEVVVRHAVLVGCMYPLVATYSVAGT